ncbi:hypothetical protein BWI93_05360 [Siphonobacter sp. BAB-5385]|uniref:hypothetical protein n=1 Tax=Siphonobacter sp. BAB-5385 TaxID=1864822 RepID=UPI000B9E4051|nr:hypothetical protein [Siphonobacter sp. BAB-5385]OZI09175.1 hypothetical protein BWI93_05360 [Siphonobacter sp. BAB-5385]
MSEPRFFIGIPINLSAFEKQRNREDAMQRLADACFALDMDELLDLRIEFAQSSDEVLRNEVATIDEVLSRIRQS